jgi:hypothetical protein
MKVLRVIGGRRLALHALCHGSSWWTIDEKKAGVPPKTQATWWREYPPTFFKKAGLYQLHGTIVRTSRKPRGERCRKAG